MKIKIAHMKSKKEAAIEGISTKEKKKKDI